MVDLHSRSHPLDKLHALWDLIDVDADRDALRKTYPGEDRIDRGHPLIVGLRVRNINGAGNTVDVAANDLTVAHQLDLGWIPHADRCKVGFFEISVDPERISIDERNSVHPNIHVVADLRQQVGHVAVNRRENARAPEIDLRLVKLCLGLRERCLGAQALRRSSPSRCCRN